MINFLNINAYLDAVASLLDLDDIPEDALASVLKGMTPDEYGAYCID
jgi:hypothetical protein